MHFAAHALDSSRAAATWYYSPFGPPPPSPPSRPPPAPPMAPPMWESITDALLPDTIATPLKTAHHAVGEAFDNAMPDWLTDGVSVAAKKSLGAGESVHHALLHPHEESWVIILAGVFTLVSICPMIILCCCCRKAGSSSQRGGHRKHSKSSSSRTRSSSSSKYHSSRSGGSSSSGSKHKKYSRAAARDVSDEEDEDEDADEEEEASSRWPKCARFLAFLFIILPTVILISIVVKMWLEGRGAEVELEAQRI